MAGAVIAALIASASRYGYHRDELYFVAAGRHLAWAYADQGPLTPFVARVMTSMAPGSLTVLRIPSAVMTGAVVVLTALLARDLGGNRRAQTIAATCSAVSVFILFTGHLLSTSTADLLVWTLASWLIVRAVRLGIDRNWLWTGLVLGVGLLNKPLPAFLAAALLVGIAISGPPRTRQLLRSPWVWGGALIAVVLWLPFLIWQSAHGWPQLEVSRSIAAGGSKSSQPWWLVVPFQVLLDGPLLAPVWIAGLVRLFRDRSVRDVRFFAWAWVVLAIAFMATGGKPYYLAGLLPLLTGAGSVPVEAWLTRVAVRWKAFIAVGALSAVVGAMLALPLLPADAAGFVIATNGDVGETVGWPDLVRTVAHVGHRLPTDAVVLTRNYGEAGAIDRYGPLYGLPRAYSGHNAYGYWGHPKDHSHGSDTVITVGYSTADAGQYFDGCRVAARIHNSAGLDNDENGEPVLVCRGPRTSWAREWHTIRHLG